MLKRSASVALVLVSASVFANEQCVVDDALLFTDYDHNQRDDRFQPNTVNKDTDYFMLVYSHSPTFCRSRSSSQIQTQFQLQCGSDNNFGWVVHGLWAQDRESLTAPKGHPRWCQGDLPKLPLSDIKPYLCMSPGTKLLQGEWEKHGSCDFDTATAYFKKTAQLHTQWRLPHHTGSASKAISWMKKNNPALKNVWLQKLGKEFGICYDINFDVMDCPKS